MEDEGTRIEAGCSIVRRYASHDTVFKGLQLLLAAGLLTRAR